MALRAIVFDLFDTLVDVHLDRLPTLPFEGRQIPSTFGLLHDTARRHGAGVDFETFSRTLIALDKDYRHRMHVERVEVPTLERFTRLVERLGLEAPALPEALTQTHMGAIEANVDAPAHHPEVLAELRKSYRLAVCSNFTHTPTAHRVLAAAGLASLLDVVVVSEEVGIRKPRREIFEATLARLGVAPGETLHIGDNLGADVGGAAAVGMGTGWITRRVADPHRALTSHDGPLPELRMRDLAELPGLLAARR